MVHRFQPAEAYRRVTIDARIAGGDGQHLVHLCLQEAIEAIEASLYANDNGFTERRGRALIRALGAIDALRLGIDDALPLAKALHSLYGAAHLSISQSTMRFERDIVASVRSDLQDIAGAFREAA